MKFEIGFTITLHHSNNKKLTQFYKKLAYTVEDT